MSVVIVTDSTCDLSLQEAHKLGVQLVPLKVIFGEETYRQGIDMDSDTFYTRLTSEKSLPSTSQPSPEDFLAAFEPAVKAGYSVVMLSLSSKISGTIQSAMIAADMAGGDIRIVDTLETIGALRLMVEYAAKLRDEGKSAAEIEEALLALRPRMHIIAVVDTLEYLFKGGRLSRTSAVVGSILQMKPVLKLEGGVICTVGKARGMKAATKLLLDEVASTKGFDPDFPIYLGYTGLDDAPCRAVAEPLKARFGDLPQLAPFIPVGCVIGTHVGPGACILCFVEAA